MSAVWILELNNRIELSGQSDPIALFPARGARSVLRYRAGKTEVHTCRLAIGIGTVERNDEVGTRSNGITLRDKQSISKTTFKADQTCRTPSHAISCTASTLAPSNTRSPLLDHPVYGLPILIWARNAGWDSQTSQMTGTLRRLPPSRSDTSLYHRLPVPTCRLRE